MKPDEIPCNGNYLLHQFHVWELKLRAKIFAQLVSSLLRYRYNASLMNENPKKDPFFIIQFPFANVCNENIETQKITKLKYGLHEHIRVVTWT